MPLLKNRIYLIAILCFTAWDSNLYAQEKALHMERSVFANSSLNSSNPSFLQNIKDSILLNVKSYYCLGKGNFTNYFSSNKYYKLGIETESYNRLNDKTVVYGLASYDYYKGKNSSGSSFLDPYRMPFNFIEKTEETKGDRQIEQYHLAGGISYHISDRWILGAKLNYKTISFAKLKDMRNMNNILDLVVSPGLAYTFTNNNAIGLSYNYSRYIENMVINKYGDTDKDYYALVNKGAFMGLFHLYGENGILKTVNKKPWVDIAHQIGIQYNMFFANKTNCFVELNYEKGKGHFGNDSDVSVVYMRHKREKYSFNTQLTLTKRNKTHMLSLSGSYARLTNKEQLFQEVTTSGGSTITNYYGENETYNRKRSNVNIQYNYYWGDEYLKAPWQFSMVYVHNNIQRKAIYYPDFRKQDINWHSISVGIARVIKCEKTAFLIKYSSAFVRGNGGEPTDGKYFSSTGSTVEPDYLNNLLYKEKEYLTAKRIISTVALRADHNYKKDMDIYLELDMAYTKPFDIEYLHGNFACFSLTAGVAF